MSAASSVTRESGDAAVADVLDLHLANAKPSRGGREPQQRLRTADESVKRDEIIAVHDVQQLVAEVGTPVRIAATIGRRPAGARYRIGKPGEWFR